MVTNAKSPPPHSPPPAEPTRNAPRPEADEAQAESEASWRRLMWDRPAISRPLRFAPECRFNRPTVAEVDLDALLHNLAEARRVAPGMRILAVVKANAYGHGAVQVARTLAGAGVDCFGVSLVEEGVDLRRAGVRGEVLVLGAAYSDYEEIVTNRLTPLVFTREHLERLRAAAARVGRPVHVHLKLDTGMGRLGLVLEQLPELLEAWRGAPELVLDGLVSHLACADGDDPEPNREQLALFRAAAEAIRGAGHPLRWRHISNSAAAIDLAETRDGVDFNMIRPGLMLYGEPPSERARATCRLEPVLSWKTSIAYLKRVPAGTAVGYGSTWRSPRESLIATLPVGYADGFSRRLSNRGEVLVRGHRAPIVGTVCMDMCMADVTAVPGVSPHDEVVLLGAQGGEAITARELAALCETIPYEILTSVGIRVPRVGVQRALEP